MTMHHARNIGILVALCAGASAAVSAQTLDVKPGLWEIAMAEPASVQKVCYTADVLKGASLASMPMPPGISCKNEVAQSSARLIVTRTVCSGPFAMEGETRLTVNSRESMAMTSTSVMTMGGTKQNVKASATYKWLSADCGNVKPFDPKTLFK